MKNTRVSTPPPSKPLGRRPGAPDTEAVILEAARAQFADRGYAGTSIRAVADRAGVDPALIHHYFGTKEALFRAALSIPIDHAALMDRVLCAGPEAAPTRLALTVLEVWDDPVTGPALLAFFRRILADAQASTLLREFATATFVQQTAAGLLSGVDPEEAQARVSLVLGHLLGVVTLRKVLCVEPVASMSAPELAGRIAPTIELLLRGQVARTPLDEEGSP